MHRLLLIAACCALACNDHPLSPIELTVSAARQQTDVQPPKTRFDFLFVVDDSGSMCQEQHNLGRNFRDIARFLYGTLGPAADFRVAVTSTDLVDDRGAFLADPAAPVPARECQHSLTGEAFVPDTADCFDGPLDPVLSSEAGLDEAEFVRRFRCLATLGTRGDNQEKGLEAMRLALSCAGPNAALFGECCVDGAYDPACQPAAEPAFLRPDATLVVVIVSDEDDCSDPAENPALSSRAICRYGPLDADLDGVPDGYRDAALCDALAPADCFRRDCGEASPEDCAARCQVAQASDACEWGREDLVPTTEYVRFLHGLKPDPLRQVVVATIVGGRVRTPDGHAVAYDPGQPSAPCALEDSLAPSDACCPDGRCRGPKRPACVSENGEAFTGRRYLSVAAAFGRNGVGCRPEDEGTDRCVTICEDDFATPLGQLQDGLVELLGLHCLSDTPECVVVDDGPRPCVGEERDAPANYSVRVDVRCGPLDDCAEAAESWSFIPREPRCGGEPAVQLAVVPPVGAEVVIRFAVDLGAR